MRFNGIKETIVEMSKIRFGEDYDFVMSYGIDENGRKMCKIITKYDDILHETTLTLNENYGELELKYTNNNDDGDTSIDMTFVQDLTLYPKNGDYKLYNPFYNNFTGEFMMDIRSRTSSSSVINHFGVVSEVFRYFASTDIHFMSANNESKTYEKEFSCFFSSLYFIYRYIKKIKPYLVMSDEGNILIDNDSVNKNYEFFKDVCGIVAKYEHLLPEIMNLNLDVFNQELLKPYGVIDTINGQIWNTKLYHNNNNFTNHNNFSAVRIF